MKTSYTYRFMAMAGFILLAHVLFAQKENAATRSGNSAYKNQNFEQAEIAYRKALELNANMPQAVFNLGDALYMKNDTTAREWFEKATALLANPEHKAFAYYNIGNTYLQTKQWQKAIDAYKASLKLEPNDMDTKYNLAYAQLMLKKEQEQQQNQQQQQQQQQENQDQQDKQDQKQDSGQDDKQQDKEQSQKQQGQPQKLTKQQAEKLLEQVRNEDSKMNLKVQKQKNRAYQNSGDKDW